MKLIRTLLFPFVPLFFLVTWLRNKLYDLGWKSSQTYDIPIICIGNLSVGGTGKTPMIEYVVRTLGNDYKIAVLSRGYKRTTKGFLIGDSNASAATLGDEPFQFLRKFKTITVAVDADRRHGIEQLRNRIDPEVILLDDAFQHRRVSAGLNILLTAYEALYCDDMVLPTGNLREPRSGAKRADIIIVTKCPLNLTNEEKNGVVKKLNVFPGQKVFFSAINYANDVLSQDGSKPLDSLMGSDFTLVTGIANPKPLLDYLGLKGLRFEHLEFGDHHEFTKEEISKLKGLPLILTTEKDYMRLLPSFKDLDNLYYLPIEFDIDDQMGFEDGLRSFLKTF